MVSTLSFTVLTVSVYNTASSGDFPAQAWPDLNADKLTRDTGAKAVRLNGPRFWTVDGLTGVGVEAGAEKKTFAGVRTSLLGVIKFDVLKGRPSTTAFEPTLVSRTVAVRFLTGRPVTRLKSPEGKTFVLISTSRPGAVREADAGLPPGWVLTTQPAAEDLVLPARSAVALLQDRSENTYQSLE